MKDLTVKQLAAASGVTVRTLHHYDEIGLLRPARVGTNGYRYYGHLEQLRLQQILFHRELGVPLSAIGGLLELETGNQIGVLRRHREKLEAERERYRALIETIDRTIAEMSEESPMENAELYKGFSPEKQAGYEAWLIERYGEPMRKGIDPAAAGVGVLIGRHRAWVAAMWGRPCSAQAYSGLADLYLGHPDFVARYERIAKGFAEYLARAMKLHANGKG